MTNNPTHNFRVGDLLVTHSSLYVVTSPPRLRLERNGMVTYCLAWGFYHSVAGFQGLFRDVEVEGTVGARERLIR